MAHTAVYGMTRIQVTLDSTDTSDWISSKPVRVKNWGFAPNNAGDVVFFGEYLSSSVIVGLPVKSISGSPIGEKWDSGDDYVTVAIDKSACTLSAASTTVVINIARE